MTSTSFLSDDESDGDLEVPLGSAAAGQFLIESPLASTRHTSLPMLGESPPGSPADSAIGNGVFAQGGRRGGGMHDEVSLALDNGSNFAQKDVGSAAHRTPKVFPATNSPQRDHIGSDTPGDLSPISVSNIAGPRHSEVSSPSSEPALPQRGGGTDGSHIPGDFSPVAVSDVVRNGDTCRWEQKTVPILGDNGDVYATRQNGTSNVRANESEDFSPSTVHSAVPCKNADFKVQLYVARLCHAAKNGFDWEVQEILKICPAAVTCSDSVASFQMHLYEKDNWDALLSAALVGHMVTAGISHEDFFSKCSVRDVNGNSVVLSRHDGVYEKSALPLSLCYVDLEKDCGNTALHCAAANGHDEVVRMLIAARAELNTKNSNGESILHAAALEGHESVVNTFLTARVDLDAVNKYGHTPLHRAARFGHAHIVSLLVNARAALEVPSRNVETLQVGFNHSNNQNGVQAAQCHPWFTTDMLVHQSRFRDFGVCSGNTALHFAAGAGHTEIAITLFFAQANLHAANAEGRTALHTAVVNHAEDVVVCLLAARADLTMRDQHLQTPLHSAACITHVNIAKLLLAANADVLSQTTDGQSVLHVALNAHVLRLLDVDAESPTDGFIFGGNVDLTKLTWGPHSSVNPCVGIEDTDDLRGMVEALLKARADPLSPDDNGSTPLHLAASNGFKSAVDSLLAARVNVNSLDASQWTPLHWAAGCGHDGVTSLLVQALADVNAKDQQRRSPLHWASGRSHRTSVGLLLEAGADVNVGDEKQFTSMHWAAARGHGDIVEILMSSKADLNCVDDQQLSPLHWAVSCGHRKVVKLLLDARADLNKPASGGHVPLHFASTDCITKLLLDSRADMTVQDSLGNIALEFAMKGGKKLPEM